MLTLRPADERGFADHGWLQSRHSFSFSEYYDRQHMHFGALRVINEDWIAPGMGFGTHGHRDMEIITYILGGAISHRDSMGNGSKIEPGNVQRMSAGSGVQHSEFNDAKDQQTHLLQIWIQPNVLGGAPSYEEKHFTDAEKRGQLRLIAAPVDEAPALGAVKIQADARVYAGLFDGAEAADLPLPSGRRAYVHVARGSLVVNGQPLHAGDALKLVDESNVHITQGAGAEVLVFDLA